MKAGSGKSLHIMLALALVGTGVFGFTLLTNPVESLAQQQRSVFMGGNPSRVDSDDVTTLTASVDWEIHVSCAMSNTAGTFSLSKSFNGLASVTLTTPEETHIVLFTLGGFGNNLVTIDGVTHGPYTLAQIRAIFGIDISID